MTEENVPCDPKIWPVNFVVNTNKRKLTDFSLLQAKRAIALKWKEIQGPSSILWIKEMTNNLAMEKLTCAVKGKLKDFYNIWTPFLRYCNQEDLTTGDD